jgi:tRNA (guanine10-N2)-methyltransferase
MPEYLVRLVQVHESFRKAELQALADVAGTDIAFASYDEDVGKIASPFLLSASP